MRIKTFSVVVLALSLSCFSAASDVLELQLQACLLLNGEYSKYAETECVSDGLILMGSPDASDHLEVKAECEAMALEAKAAMLAWESLAEAETLNTEPSPEILELSRAFDFSERGDEEFVEATFELKADCDGLVERLANDHD
jgi:hypothetical protein